MSTQIQPAAQLELPMLADHPALDLLNTVPLINGELVDTLQSDQDVLQWLTRAGWPLNGPPTRLQPSSLLSATRSLRETIRTLVEAGKSGKPADLTALNGFLAGSESHLQLSLDKKRNLTLERQWTRQTPIQILAPLAEAAAELLATSDFNLIRQCEDSECVLWFYDRTKSHHRRWCSMSTCGNRNKVAAFRKRQQGA